MRTLVSHLPVTRSVAITISILLTIACDYTTIVTAFLTIPSSHTINYHHHYPVYYLARQHARTALSSTQTPPAEQDWSINAIEEARHQLEHLIGPMIFDDNDNSTSENDIVNIDKKKPHLLTNAGRKRREIEIRLLQSLLYSDDAIDELMSLWIYECPNQIVNIDILQFMSSKDSACTVKEAEMILRNIIADCPTTVWSEPGARLAYLLFLQEQYEECEQYVTSVLLVKPWHFEMAQLQILLELAYHSSTSGAIRVSRQHGLPPLHHTKQRYRWVQNATRQAQEQLQRLESYTAAELHDGPIDPKEDHHLLSSLTATSFIASWQ